MTAAVWSASDFPYMCLLDERRTRAFVRAVRDAVRPGAHVVDAGSGTGILALTAALAGAGHVIAVELDPTMAAGIERAAHANGCADRVTVLVGDLMEVDLPRADVLIAELVETALIDEMQVPVLNRLARDGVVDRDTVLVPGAYRTLVDLVDVDDEFYGVVLYPIRHDWPFQDYGGQGWHPRRDTAVSDTACAWAGSFRDLPIVDEVSTIVSVSVRPGHMASALRVRGVAEVGGTDLGETHSFNGTKVVPVPPRELDADTVSFRLSYVMGQGLATLRFDWL